MVVVVKNYTTLLLLVVVVLFFFLLLILLLSSCYSLYCILPVLVAVQFPAATAAPTVPFPQFHFQ